MPIKLPKHFPRRRSSGNALEEQPTPTESSFRVLERPSNRSFEGPDHLRRLSQGRPLSADQLKGQAHAGSGVNNNNRGSGATNNSASSGGRDNSSISARYSSTSTLPSSTDIPVDERPPPKHSFTMPIPPVSESTGIASLKAAGRAFSFGRKKADAQNAAVRPPFEHAASDGKANYSRERAHTESSYTSESTATPPKLLGPGLDFGSSENFGLMFEGFGKRASQIVAEPGHMTPGDTSTSANQPGGFTQQNLHHDANLWMDGDHQDHNVRPAAPLMERTFSYEDVTERIDHPTRLAKSRTTPLANEVLPSTQQRSTRPLSNGFRRSSAYTDTKHTQSGAGYLDEDASLVMNSLAVGRRLEMASAGGFHDSDEEDNPTISLVDPSRKTPSPNVTAGAQQYPGRSSRSPGPSFEGVHSQLPSTKWQNSTNSTPRANVQDSWPQERSLFDSSPPLNSQAYKPGPSMTIPPKKPQTSNKIMTPAQFEKYRREQEMNQAEAAPNDQTDSDDENDGSEDDDEIEKNKQIAKERRKQEAHLAIYRQQMMKVTGEHPLHSSNLQLRLASERSNASPSVNQRPESSLEINFDKPADGDKASDDEDEDVPLGVLAAHGFPSKNRPPTAMSGRESRIQYKSESYPPPPASSTGASQAGRASGLPPFAKNLPHDPYYGASLVNPSNRESLAYGNQSQATPPIPSNPPHVPPAGLVGVIAGEERARAARRGSPNPPMPQHMGQVPGMPPGMPPVMSPGERATVQMSEQMAQMMQMQMQWMQQMQQMMASGMPLQTPPPMPMMAGQPGMPMPPVMPVPPGQGQRPTSSGAAYGPPNPASPLQGGRAMSMMNSSTAPPWPPTNASNRQSRTPSMFGEPAPRTPGYTPSIAPSERSNVGMPSRYRPVSVVPGDQHISRAHSRTSTMNSNSLQPGGTVQDGRLSVSRERKSQLSFHSLAPKSPRTAGSDDDDEEGWEEMKKKRDKKKGLWRINRKKEEAVAPDLEYYDYTGE